MVSSDPPPDAVSSSNAAAPDLNEPEGQFEGSDSPASSAGVGAAFDDPLEARTEAAPLDLVLDIPVRLSVELGRTEIPIRDVVTLGRGSMIELDGSPGAPLDVRVNGVLIGRGEVVVINEERLGLRFIEVASQSERIKRLR
jgi:flagellar motor switch protein FliN/FliY